MYFKAFIKILFNSSKLLNTTTYAILKMATDYCMYHQQKIFHYYTCILVLISRKTCIIILLKAQFTYPINLISYKLMNNYFCFSIYRETAPEKNLNAGTKRNLCCQIRISKVHKVAENQAKTFCEYFQILSQSIKKYIINIYIYIFRETFVEQ